MTGAAPPAATAEVESAEKKTVPSPSSAPHPPGKLLPDGFLSHTSATAKVSYKSMKGFRFLEKGAVDNLKAGQALYAFGCDEGKQLGAFERGLISRVINLTAFQPGDADATPFLDMEKDSELKNIFMLNKAMYALPGITLSDISPQRIASVEFQKACQPGACKVWDDCTRDDTFRLTKTIIRAIYKMTIQFRCSWVPDEHLVSLREVCDGLEVHKAILLERTKRDRSYVDSTKKVRSILLYHAPVGGGLVVTNFTCVCNTSVPTVVAKLVDKLGWAGASEVAETAEKTRSYFVKAKMKKK